DAATIKFLLVRRVRVTSQKVCSKSGGKMPAVRIKRLSGRIVFITAIVLSSAPVVAHAQDAYKIGMSAGLTGYAATVDRAWRDGVEIAIAAVNAAGGIDGRKVELVVEDN